jgi:shikimate kinase
MKRITEFINGWSPLHLRRRIVELQKEYGESLDELTEQRDDLVNECHRTVLKENERLRKEVERLRNCYRDLLSVFRQNTDSLERVLRNQKSACAVLGDSWKQPEEEKGETE